MAGAAIPVVIRDERPSDGQIIHGITQAAFADREFSSGMEGAIIRALRNDGDLSLSLVAEHEDVVVGHIAFSPVTIAGERDGLYALGPVSARPDLRHRRIGTALIEEGLARLQAMGATACVLVGDPAYYSRFGFAGDVGLTHDGLPPRVVQMLAWDGVARRGEIDYAPGFGR